MEVKEEQFVVYLFRKIEESLKSPGINDLAVVKTTPQTNIVYEGIL